MSAVYFMLAAVFEIAGCYAFWLILRLDKSLWWILPGALALLLFALCLTRIEADFAGRAYAAYGGIYIVMSLLWAATIERQLPAMSDILGGALCLAGAMVIFLQPDSATAS